MNEPMQSTSFADNGLRSARGIRWLLLAGAMVTGVSIYRLVQSQWASLPVPLQFLILVGGALAIFGLGAFTRRRLHLPYAGSALLFLFTGLVPVLGWGAAYLRLLDTFWGWLAFSAGGAALLGAAVRVLRSELRYPGRLYPAVMAVLFAAQPALPWLAERWDGRMGGFYMLVGLTLGALLHVGSRHINRFFFHRDRQDGRERPIHLLPFLLLGVLYSGALSLLDLDSTFMALPVAMLGIVLAGTGEEYYQALARSLGQAPKRWPGRSVALLALGFSLAVISLPLALRDASGYCLPLVSLCVASFFVKWGLTYGHRTAHVAGVLAALIGYQSLLDLVDITGSAVLTWWNLGFLAILIGLGALLARLRAAEGLRRTHAVLIALHVLWTAFLACLDIPDYQGLHLLAAGAIWIFIGYRQRMQPFLLLGGLMLSFGVHAQLWIELDGITPWTALVTQAFFVLSWLATRRLSVRVSAQALTFVHGVAGVLWLVKTSVASTVVVEPLILLLAGLAMLHDGFAGRRHESSDLGLTAALLWLPVQTFFLLDPVWSSGLILCLTIFGMELALLSLLARRAPGHWAARRYGLEADDWNVLASLSLRGVTRVWLVLAVAACVLFTGADALVLALMVVAVEFLNRTEIEGWARRLAFPARLALLPMLQLVVLAAAGGDPGRDLFPALLSLHLHLLPWIAILGLAWRGMVDALGRRNGLRPWTLALELIAVIGYVAAFRTGFGFALWMDVALIALAAAWAAVSFFDGRRELNPGHGWRMQIWGGLAVLHAFTAGWLHFGSGVAPYVLLAAGAAQYVLGVLFERSGHGASFTDSCRQVGLALPFAAGVLALMRAPVATSVWFPTLAAFLVSLFYMIVASRESRRVFPSLAAAGFLALALLKAFALAQLGMELYFLAPGLALLALAWMLRAELGPVWSRHVTAAGASFVYATPIVALSDQISWGWLAALLICTVAFGAASFVLRSRSLLTVSTAAMLTDLGFFVFRIGTTAPMALWVIGLAFGLALMAGAAYLEYQREGVLQQIRVFGRELQAWN